LVVDLIENAINTNSDTPRLPSAELLHPMRPRVVHKAADSVGYPVAIRRVDA